MAEDETVTFRIAEAARLVGVAPSTLRLWETQGLVSPQRQASGQRLYSAADVARLREVASLRRDRGLNAAAIRDQTPAPATAPETGEIGRRIRLLRQTAGKTQGQVAADLGIAASALSTFERTGQGLSFKALGDVAQYFGTTVSALSEVGGAPARDLVRNGEWRSWPRSTPGVTVQLLAETASQMDCHRFVLAPGASSEGAYRHAGEEFLHLLSGRLEVVLDQTEIHDLRPGDSLYFASSRHHAWANRDPGETVLIWVNTPRTF